MAGPVCETHRLSNLMDILLKPFLKHVKSYVRDDIDFLQYIPKRISEDTILVSFNVTSLYTNISHELGVEAMTFWLDKYPELINGRFSKEFLIESMKIILENNNFYFNDHFYTQKRGTAMGTKFAPLYATLVVGFLEEKLYLQADEIFENGFGEMLKANWGRFLDDCFVFWEKKKKKTRQDLSLFFDLLNTLHQDIIFTMETSEKSLSFLDILIIKEHTEIITEKIFQRKRHQTISKLFFLSSKTHKEQYSF